MDKEYDGRLSRIRGLIEKWIVNPSRENPIPTVFSFGVLFAILGSGPLKGFEQIDYFKWAPGLLTSLGLTIVGAGVFAFLLKTAQFSEHFQNILLKVLYDPQSLSNTKDLVARWEAITEGVLSTLLPATHADAVSLISDRYFDDELEYHFEDMCIKFRFHVKEDGHTISVDQWVTGDICPSPGYPNAKLSQKIAIRGDGCAELKALNIGGRELIKAGKVSPEFDDAESKREKEISVNIVEDGGEGGQVRYYRHISFEQDLRQEPYFQIELIRFAKGYRIEVESPPKFKLLFNGDSEPEREDVLMSESADGSLHWSWEAATKKQLLLPGDSCMILLLCEE